MKRRKIRIACILVLVTIVMNPFAMKDKHVLAAKQSYLTKEQVQFYEFCFAHLGNLSATNEEANYKQYGYLLYCLLNDFDSSNKLPVEVKGKHAGDGRLYSVADMKKLLTAIVGDRDIDIKKCVNSGLSLKGEFMEFIGSSGGGWGESTIIDITKGKNGNLVVTGYSYCVYDGTSVVKEVNGNYIWQSVKYYMERFTATLQPDSSCFSGYRLLSNKVSEVRNPKGTLSVSSTLVEKGYDHSKRNLVDGKMETAWVEGKSGSGVGETIQYKFKKKTKIYGVAITNGYFKNENVFRKNQRIKNLTLQAGKKKKNYTCIDFSELEYIDSYSLGYTDLILFDQPVTTTTLKLTINTVYPGTAFTDTCVSEFQILYQ